MTTTIAPLVQRPAWQALAAHYPEIRDLHLRRQLFADDPRRGEQMTVEALGIYLDYSKNRVTDETLRLLLQLAEESGLRSRIDAMFRGDKINVTEQRAVLHVALRTPKTASIIVDGEDVVPQVHAVLDKMAGFSNRVRSGEWKGHTGKTIRNIVNVGIGGSDLGPVMAYEALRHYSRRDLTSRFVSNVDGTDFAEATHDLDAEETLFIIASKTFTTQETMTNAHSARDWALRTLKDPAAVARHFVAVSTNAKEVAKFGIDTANMFEFWDWVGGRYSMTSAIGLSTMLAIGPDNFRALLDGFHEMDEHFRAAPFERNLPVLIGLLGLWYSSFFGRGKPRRGLALRAVPETLPGVPQQQLTMESKRQARHAGGGTTVTYQTGPVYWGEPGTNGQHSFYQLIHQGTKLIPCDFIAFAEPLNPLGRHHDLLLCQRARPGGGHSGLRQTRPRRCSPKRTPAWSAAAPHVRGQSSVQHLPAGNGWCSMRTRHWGNLVALYEHSVFTQGVIWQVDSFDQWGVELGKVLAQRIIPELESPSEPPLYHDELNQHPAPAIPEAQGEVASRMTWCACWRRNPSKSAWCSTRRSNTRSLILSSRNDARGPRGCRSALPRARFRAPASVSASSISSAVFIASTLSAICRARGSVARRTSSRIGGKKDGSMLKLRNPMPKSGSRQRGRPAISPHSVTGLPRSLQA